MSTIDEKCKGCLHVVLDSGCEVYEFPEAKWSYGNCPMNTHLRKVKEKKEKFIDPIKLSKRKMKGA
jgi:hypothetical protein